MLQHINLQTKNNKTLTLTPAQFWDTHSQIWDNLNQNSELTYDDIHDLTLNQTYQHYQNLGYSTSYLDYISNL